MRAIARATCQNRTGDLLFTRELMIPLASGEADVQNIPTSQNVSIGLTFLSLQLNSGLVPSLLDVSDQPPND